MDKKKKTPKQIAALVCVGLLLLLYLATLVVACLTFRAPTACSRPAWWQRSGFPSFCGYISGCSARLRNAGRVRIIPTENKYWKKESQAAIPYRLAFLFVFGQSLAAPPVFTAFS